MHGDLIEMSGTMSGGGKPKSGRMSFLPSSHADEVMMSDENKIYTKEDLDMVTKKLYELRERKSMLKNQESSLQRSLKGFDEALDLAVNSIRLLEEDIDGCTKTVKLLEDQIG